MPRAPWAGAIAFDIETSGLEPDALVTVACVWSPERQARCFHGEDPSEVVALLDAARYIHAYNGIQFDLPRFARRCGRTDYSQWALKTVDPLYLMKCTMGLGACVKLADVLKANGLASKSGSGLEAIELWRQGEYEALSNYCMDDCRLTYQLCEAREIEWAGKWTLRLREARVIVKFHRQQKPKPQ